MNTPSIQYPTWEPADLADYDAYMTSRVSEVIDWLRSLSESEWLAAIKDPREIHRRLYENLTPPNYPEYAGNYRGSDEWPSLKNRNIGISSEIASQVGQVGFQDASGVTSALEKWRLLVDVKRSQPKHSPEDVAKNFTLVFRLFGAVHPFLNGNGHVQRIILQTLVERSGFFVREGIIHPRWYDIEMAEALNAKNDAAIADLLNEVILADASVGQRTTS